MSIKIIDLFAGPGGLGEGFSSYKSGNRKPFNISISIEKDEMAHKTLSLRSFYRKFDTPPKEYYLYLQGKIDREQLFEIYPDQAQEALNEACCIELGSEAFPHDIVMEKIERQLGDANDCILIGGPPCQAYSLAGRARMANDKSRNQDFEKDPRHTLYKEYLKVIAEFKPSVFVMENVKGILSSKLDGEYIFDKILDDLRSPQKLFHPQKIRFNKNETYTIYSLSADKTPESLNKKDYIIKSEEYGIPQKRHRVILLGVRNDITKKPNTLNKQTETVTVQDVISDLPKLRSGLSKEVDTYESWRDVIKEWNNKATVHKGLTRGEEFITHKGMPTKYSEWYHDRKISGVINHTTRGHMNSDLYRYYYAASKALHTGVSPKLADFPTELLPQHKNIKKNTPNKSIFNDRFRVQIKDDAATTVTSHISKDGHYFIHYDPSQCRSLTAREAARIQTFPDNYKFEGGRTAQYHQVGNAVPPLLAKQIANVVYELLS